MSVTTGGSQNFAVWAESERVDAALCNIKLGDFLDAAGTKFIELLDFAGIAIPLTLGLDLFDDPRPDND